MKIIAIKKDSNNLMVWSVEMPNALYSNRWALFEKTDYVDKLTNDQLEAATYIFEKSNGNSHDKYFEQVISDSGLSGIPVKDLKRTIVDGLNEGIYVEWEERVTAYWALGKLGDSDLIVPFRKWLSEELKNENEAPVFQILIGLDRIGEPAFAKGRTSRYYDQTDQNLRDAENYLKKTMHNTK